MIRKVNRTKKKRVVKEPPDLSQEKKEQIIKDLFLKKEVLLREHEANTIQAELPNARFHVRGHSYQRAYFSLIWI